MKSICIIADGYPYGESNHCVFVRDLVVEMARLGTQCTVIAPRMQGSNNSLPYKWIDKTSDGIEIPVYFPKYFACSSKKGLMALTMRNHRNAILKVLKKEKINPDVIYGHFIYLNGISAVSIAQKYGIKSFIACGENSNRLLKGSKPYSTGLKYHGWKEKLKSVDGVICVSEENKNLIINNGFFDNDSSMMVIPNAVNTDIYKPYDKIEMRRKFKVNDKDFVVAFVGSFIERKGPKRLDEAVKDIEGVKTIFIGRGDFMPKSNCIFCGSVKHDLIPEYLSMADVFVLPTTGEGCCNAIIEAICCGLPIVSSKGRFNDDILDESYAIRIDPMSIDDIKKSVLILKEKNVLCAQMRENAINKANTFSLVNRAKKILNFIEEHC